MDVKEGTWLNEHWVLFATDESRNSTSEANKKKSGWGGSLPLGVLVKNTGNELMSGICFQIIQGWRSWGEGLDL